MADISTPGYGFPATFGLVIAAIIGVIVIQLLILRDEKKEEKSSNISQETDTSTTSRE